MKNTLTTLTIDQVAEILKKSPATVRSDLARNPSALPPVVRIENSRRPLWRLIDVERWLEERVE